MMNIMMYRNFISYDKTCIEWSFNFCVIKVTYVSNMLLWKASEKAKSLHLLLFDFDLIDVLETWSILYLFTYEKLPILFDSIVDGSVTFWISIGYKKLHILLGGEERKKLLRCLSESYKIHLRLFMKYDTFTLTVKD